MHQQPSAKTIVLMRHAKAEQSGPTDHARALSPRGTADARCCGAWLSGRGLAPDRALVSAATRTRQTWEALAAGAGWDLAADLDEGLFAAGPDTALDLVRATPGPARTLVVVGHNPTVAHLAQLLDDGDGDPEAGNDMALGYPTAAMSVFTYPGDWADLGEATASLVAFHVGRAED